jgi:hypothetical protein
VRAQLSPPSPHRPLSDQSRQLRERCRAIQESGIRQRREAAARPDAREGLPRPPFAYRDGRAYVVRRDHAERASGSSAALTLGRRWSGLERLSKAVKAVLRPCRWRPSVSPQARRRAPGREVMASRPSAYMSIVVSASQRHRHGSRSAVLSSQAHDCAVRSAPRPHLFALLAGAGPSI